MNLIFLDLALLSSQKFSSLFYHCLLFIDTFFSLDCSPAVIFISIPPLAQVSFHPSFPVSRHTLTFPVIQIFPLLNGCLLSYGLFQANSDFNPSKLYMPPFASQHMIILDHKLQNLITIYSYAGCSPGTHPIYLTQSETLWLPQLSPIILPPLQNSKKSVSFPKLPLSSSRTAYKQSCKKMYHKQSMMPPRLTPSQSSHLANGREFVLLD